MQQAATDRCNDMDMQLAYERVSEHIGRTYRIDIDEIREIDFLRFANAVGGDLSVTMDSDSAAMGLATITAPPLYLTAVSHWGWGPPETDLRSDGTSSEQLAEVPLEGLRLMGGGQSLQFYQPVVAGTSITIETRVNDVQLKNGRSGQLLLIEVERMFLSDGKPVVRCIETFIGR